MKTQKKVNNNIRTLRKIFGQNQANFAAMIGVSKDAVVSWENARNPLSEGFAQRIARATGVAANSLLGTGPLWVEASVPRRPYTREEFDKHRKRFGDSSNQNSAARQLGPCEDALGLLFRAAVMAGERTGTVPLPAVVHSFVQWCRQTEEDFKLLKDIEAQLSERKAATPLTKTIKQWRETAKQDPRMAKLWGFKDDPKRDENESLTLTAMTIPDWAPGWDMRRGKG